MNCTVESGICQECDRQRQLNGKHQSRRNAFRRGKCCQNYMEKKKKICDLYKFTLFICGLSPIFRCSTFFIDYYYSLILTWKLQFFEKDKFKVFLLPKSLQNIKLFQQFQRERCINVRCLDVILQLLVTIYNNFISYNTPDFLY